MAAKPRLKITDVPEKMIAFYAKRLGIDTIEVVDRLVVRGDNIFLSLLGLGDPDHKHLWVWSCGDEEDDELDELLAESHGAGH